MAQAASACVLPALDEAPEPVAPRCVEPEAAEPAVLPVPDEIGDAPDEAVDTPPDELEARVVDELDVPVDVDELLDDDWSDSTEAWSAARVARASSTAVLSEVGSRRASSWPCATVCPITTDTEATFADTGKCAFQLSDWVTLPVRARVWVTSPSPAVAVTYPPGVPELLAA